MGEACSRPSLTLPTRSERKMSVLNSKLDIQFNAGQFVQENKHSFHAVYKLNDNHIGSGGFAEVWLATHNRTGDTRAVKIFKKSDISEEEIASRSVFEEVEILKSLDHPNILKIYEYFEDADHFYIVMEYCEGGDVFDKIEKSSRLSERYAAKIMNYLLIGVNYLHSKLVVHRDIKPENILLINKAVFRDMNIKIIDFNVAAVKSDSILKEVTGTTDYMAPEVFTGIYNEKCDLWSCGVVLYLMVSGQLPFVINNDKEAENVIRNSKLKFGPEFDLVSKDCKDLITKLLSKNPSSRPSASQALSHPWLRLNESSINQRSVSCTLRKMQTVSSRSKLKDFFTTFIVSQICKTNSVKKYEQIFYAIDVDKNGVITKDELVKQLSLEMDKKIAEERACKMMKLIDIDGSGEIDFTEFMRVAVDQDSLLSKENLRKAFVYFDKDGSEAIEKEELTQWLCTGGIIPEAVVNELMEEADTNGDGTIDIEEFEALLAEKLDIN